MAKANTIEEYLELLANGHTNIQFDFSNPELTKFALEGYMKDIRKVIEGFFKIEAFNNSYRYRLSSILPFGRHKGNKLAAIYKCDPEYIQWCLLNASAFSIAKDDITILINTKVFNSDDLIIREIDSDTYEVDFSSFKIDSNGFPINNAIANIDFSFTNGALKCNEEKLLVRHNTSDVLRGGNWKDNSMSLFKGRKSRRIIVKL